MTSLLTKFFFFSNITPQVLVAKEKNSHKQGFVKLKSIYTAKEKNVWNGGLFFVRCI